MPFLAGVIVTGQGTEHFQLLVNNRSFLLKVEWKSREFDTHIYDGSR